MKHIPYLMLLVAGSTSAQFAVVPYNDDNNATDKRFAWGENIGWVNFAPKTLTMLDLPYFDEHIASGFAWAENAGWINLGNGAPADGFQYLNADASDFGVNIETDGALTGFAWAENIGWINFGPFADLVTADHHARIVLAEGRLRGFAWAENVGWISFDSDEFNQFVRLRCLADTNFDGFVTSSDFIGWIAGFNDGRIECDQNRDGLCTPTDFTAWINNFSMGCLLNQ